MSNEIDNQAFEYMTSAADKIIMLFMIWGD